MSQEQVQSLILKQLDEIKSDMRTMRDLMSKEHAALSEKVTALSNRVRDLEHHEKISRWIWAGCGGAIAIILRELIPKILGLGG